MSSLDYHNPRVVCRDGFSMSVQARNGAYCRPRIDGAESYTSVEVGYPTEQCPILRKYAENRNARIEDGEVQTVYPYIPVELVRQVIANHGGMVSGRCPAGVNPAQAAPLDFFEVLGFVD